MGRFGVTLCLVPQSCGRGVEYLPEDQVKVALGSALTRVDRVLSHASPHRIAGAVADSVRAAPAFTHQLNILIDNGNSMETLVPFLCDITAQQSSDDELPLQCMIFASDEASVVCEILGKEEMGSVRDVVKGMRQIVLVGLKYKQRTVTLLVVDQLSTTLIAAMLNSAWCHLWLVQSGHQVIERSVTVLREAVAVCDAAKDFRHSPDSVVTGPRDIEALLQARASSDMEAQQLAAWWRQYTLGDESAPCQAIADENVALRTERAQLQAHWARREEDFARQLKETEHEIERLKQALQEAEASATELGSRLVENKEETRAQKEGLTAEQSEGDKRLHQLLQEYHDRFGELKEENMRNVLEFHEREKEWQAELRREAEGREMLAEECRQLRTVVAEQGSSMDLVKGALQATRALQEQEIDELLNKVRAISSASTSVGHRRVSPRPVERSGLRNRIRVLSPAPIMRGTVSP
ncbi:hypothetical protein DQ04_00271280 [Trypanosoma grayi]|uniref:hypothetical protein n=1 Tax=Trypanosoma grayi TaxID=71804 RepID=UPI0004F4A4FB|nr:hypothetical protein DQ04_00271280 [Trypanosoma grayi]KEG14894.1 hypothetical protein DQ04_00271280 [Trypanosoma grayi]